MSSRWTEEEARAFGLVKDKNGNWHQRQTVFLRPDTNAVPKSQPVLQRNKANDSNEKNLQSRRPAGGRFRVVVTSISWRHRDTDNLCAKWWIDMLRKRIFPDDSSAYVVKTELVVRIVPRSEPEGTLIEVFKVEE